jgi:purine-binding chemotaxis protein CheW
MTGRRRTPGEGPPPPERKLELPHSGLASEVLGKLHGEGAPAPEPSAPAAPQRRAEDPLAAPERIYAFADRLAGAAREAAEPPEELETWVAFLLDGDTFALPVTHVHEIVRVAAITRVPHAPFPIRGITNLRGQVLPVVDLRLRLGLAAAAAPTEQSRILVATSRSRTVGLLVDAVAQVVRLAPSKVQPPPPDVMTERSEYIRGVYDLATELAILLDIGQVLLIPPTLEPPARRPARSRRRKN